MVRLSPVTTIIKSLIGALIIAVCAPAKATTYYVSTTGLPNNPGTIALPWSFAHAATNAIAGDVVYVKAGNYGALNLVFPNSGTNTNRISFIGYTSNPGDIDSTNMPANPSAYLSGNYTNVFPTLNGGNRMGGGNAMQFLNENNITIKNFHITQYERALDVYGSLCKNLTIENIIATYLGDTTAYSGVGIQLAFSDSSEIKNSFVYNSAAQGISISQASYSSIKYCKVFCDENNGLAATDYYILINSGAGYSSRYNIIEGCYVERVGNLTHPGHGIILSTHYSTTDTISLCEYNIVKKCTTNNTAEFLTCRGFGVRNNLLEDNVSLQTGMIFIGEAASYNVFNRNKIINENWGGAVCFWRSPITTIFPQFPYAAKGNKINNCIIINPVNVAVSYNWFSQDSSAAINNEFNNCHFIGDSATNSALYYCQRKSIGTKFTNCIISGFQTYQAQGYGPPAPQYTPYATYTNCNFYNNNFTQQSMTGATIVNPISANPQFVNPSNGDYHLLSSSPCIDAGTTIALNHDFDLNQRPCANGYDIGAYEFQNCTSGITEPSVAQISVFPNPFTNNITITGIKSNALVKIVNTIGETVLMQTIQSGTSKINTEGLPSGFYFVRIEIENMAFVEKMVRQ